MNYVILLISVILGWIAVIVGLYQRGFKMPLWFENPPASFERIRLQSKKARLFWIPLSVLYILSLIISWFLNDQSPGARTHIIGAIACFGLTGILSAIYFVPEVLAFIKWPTQEAPTPGLLKRTRRWLRWTIIRDILQLLSALFATIAYRHA
jgi:hypothetical protein